MITICVVFVLSWLLLSALWYVGDGFEELFNCSNINTYQFRFNLDGQTFKVCKWSNGVTICGQAGTEWRPIKIYYNGATEWRVTHQTKDLMGWSFKGPLADEFSIAIESPNEKGWRFLNVCRDYRGHWKTSITTM